MIQITVENIITDLRKNGVVLNDAAFDMINQFVDIQNSFAYPITVSRWQDVRDKTVLVCQDGTPIALYDKGRFMYNTNKIKVSQLPDYEIYELDIQGTHVQNRREQRSDALSGLTPTRDAQYSKVPTSSNYIWDKDWNPEVNKVYYLKLLQRKHLNGYVKQLEDAYDIVIELINQRKSRLTGKRSEYDRLITKISNQITKIEDIMTSVEQDFNVDTDSLAKEMAKLPRLVQTARDFLDTEAKEYATWGVRKKRPLQPIQK